MNMAMRASLTSPLLLGACTASTPAEDVSDPGREATSSPAVDAERAPLKDIMQGLERDMAEAAHGLR